MKQRGAALVEFALTALFFFTVIFAIIDFSYLFWVNLTMQHAVREGVRFAVVGRTLPNPNNPKVQLDLCSSAEEIIRDNSMGLYDKLSPTIQYSTVDSAGKIVPIPSGSCWSAGQIIMIEITCNSPLLTPLVQPFFSSTGGSYIFKVSTTMKNEAF